MTIESVKQILIESAMEHTTVQYREILTRHGLVQNDYSYYKLFGLLLKIGEQQRQGGRPLINVLAVGSDGSPGIGFFKWLKNKKTRSLNLRDSSQLRLVGIEIIGDCYNYYSVKHNQMP